MIVYLCKIKSTDENCLWDYCLKNTGHFKHVHYAVSVICVPHLRAVCLHCPPGQEAVPKKIENKDEQPF